MTDYKLRVEEHVRSINELTITKNKLISESTDSSHRLEDAENKVTYLLLPLLLIDSFRLMVA